MTDLKTILHEVFDFSKRFGIDAGELLLMITNANGTDAPKQHAAIVLAGAEARAVVDAVVTAQRSSFADVSVPIDLAKIVNPKALAADTFERAKMWWIGRERGFAATAREIYEGAGYEYPERSRRLTEWLIRSGTARFAGTARGTMVFKRI